MPFRENVTVLSKNCNCLDTIPFQAGKIHDAAEVWKSVFAKLEEAVLMDKHSRLVQSLIKRGTDQTFFNLGKAYTVRGVRYRNVKRTQMVLVKNNRSALTNATKINMEI